MREKGCPRGLALLLLILVCGLSPAQAGTHRYIFVEEPIARFSPATGDSDLFGYAVTLHRVDNTGDPYDFDHAIRNTKIIVGAPSGTYPGGLPRFTGVNDSESLNGTGLVYTCPIVSAECESLSGNEVGDDIRMFDYEGNQFITDDFGDSVQSEQKSGQFMGATIISTGEHIVVCAPRWISLDTSDSMYGLFDKTRGHGRCFFTGRNLTDFQFLRPCTMDSSRSQGGQAYCMAGTSATLYERQASNVSVFLGGPPYDDSAGVVFQYDVSANHAVPENFEFIPGKETNKRFWYSGIAVATGRFLNSNDRDLAYSLPKKNDYRGAVQIYSLSNRMIEVEVLGKQLGEYFGWVVTTADLNGDSFDELIVGAPLFSTPDEIELGRIFIFKNNGSLDTENPIVILGTANKGRFGSAIANLGDINSDGFEDIVVSAPFEEETPANGAEGAVYIFLGSGDSYIIQPYEERISAFQISELLGLDASNYLQSFGYSLSSGVDVDANFNNDLVIGGYKQQAVIVLRTHSIANISLSLATNPQEQLEYNNPNCSVGSDMFACFDLEISASFSGRGLENRSLDVVVDVTENPVMLGARLFFLDSERNRVDSFKGTLNFTKTEDPVQKTITVYVENDISDRRTPLSVVVSVSSLPREPRSVNGSQDIIDLRDIPLLNVLPQNNLEIELTLAGCANPKCEPDLELTLNKVRYLDPNGEPTAHDEIVAGGVGFIEVTLDYRTLTEDAVESFLILDLPSTLLEDPQSIKAIIGAELATPQCPPVSGQSDKYTCDLQPIFSNYDRVFQVQIVIPVKDVIGDEENDVATFVITNSDRSDNITANNNVTVPLIVSARASIRIQELRITPDTTQYEDTDELGTRISLRANLINDGPSTIPGSQLRIFLPGRTEKTGEFYYLYPITYTSSSPSAVVCFDLNPDGLDTNQQSRRRRRSTLPGSLKRLHRMIRGEGDDEHKIRKRAETQVVNCGSDPELCTPITCNVTDFERGQLSVTVISFVDNRFFRSQSGDFEFYAQVTFKILSSFVSGGPQNNTSNKLLVQEPDEGKSEDIGIWVYIVSGVAALIILAIIILLLYLVGFFRLRRKESILKERAERSTAAATKTTDESLDSKPENAASLDSKPENATLLDSKPDQELDEKPSADPAGVEAEKPDDNISDDIPEETKL